MTTKTFLQRFEEEITALLNIVRRKNSDYADSAEDLTKEALIARFNKNDPFRNFGLVEHLGITDMESGILVRMCDKISRIATLHAKSRRGEDRRVTDESIRDTLRDLANYAIIMCVAMERGSETVEVPNIPFGYVDTPSGGALRTGPDPVEIDVEAFLNQVVDRPVCPNCGRHDCIGAMDRHMISMSPILAEALSFRVPVGAAKDIEGITLGEVIANFVGPYDVNVVADVLPVFQPEALMGYAEPLRPMERTGPSFEDELTLRMIDMAGRPDVNFNGRTDLLDKAAKSAIINLNLGLRGTEEQVAPPVDPPVEEIAAPYSPFDLKPGDMIVLGKRQWKYLCRSQDFTVEADRGNGPVPHRPYAQEQNEWVFESTLPEASGALGRYRVFSQSEIQALIDAGNFVFPAGVVVETKVIDREAKGGE